ncbi:branched-chain amino acid aminotransferase, partial [Microbacterium sp. SUBG005]
MAWRFALMIDPVASAEESADFSDSLRVLDPSAPALELGELSAQRGDGVFESIGVV